MSCCYIVILACFTGYIIGIITFNSGYLSKTQRMYKEMNVIADMAYQEGQILLFSAKIWDNIEYKYPTTVHSQLTPHLIQAAETLANNFNKIVVATYRE